VRPCPPATLVEVVTLLYTDGAALGNPGRGGWAYLAILEDGERREGVGGDAMATDNAMELTAAIEGLNSLPPSRVKLVSDSKYVVKGFTEWLPGWQKRGWKRKKNKPVLNLDLWKQLVIAVERHESVSFQWTRGHDGHPENELVDELAQAAALNHN
jgi:ribonuclease HI